MKSFICKKTLVTFLALGIVGLFTEVSAQVAKPGQGELADSILTGPYSLNYTGEDTIQVAAVEEIEYIPIEPNELIQDRLGCLDTEMSLTYNNVVRGFIDYFTVRNRKYTKTMIRRRDVYFPIFEEALKRHGMPDEIKYLAIVESGLNPRAQSRVGAVGLWQFMPGTGKDFRLYQDQHVDERMDPYKATEAACLYLKQLYGMFNDWELALASYNCGPGNVRRAIRKVNGNKQGFWDIYPHLPQETRSYVPQFIAVTYAMNYAKEHNFNPDSLLVPIPHDTILINSHVNLELLAQQLELDVESLRFLNPALKKDIVPEYKKNYALRIPVEKKPFFLENKLAILDSVGRRPETLIEEPLFAVASEKKVISKKVYYTVRKGDGLTSIANKHNVSVADLRKWNSIKGSNIKVGQKLAVMQQSVATTQPQLASKTTKPEPKADNTAAKAKAQDKVYKVQPGDTLWLISQKVPGLTVDQIIKMNNLKGKNIKPGQKLIIG